MNKKEMNRKQIELLKEMESREKESRGRYEWQESIWSLEDGLYKPKGVLTLPFSAERTQDRGVVVWTSFHDAYLIDGGVLKPSGYWCEQTDSFQDTSSRSDHWRHLRNERVGESLIFTNRKTCERAVEAHVQGYFSLRNRVLTGKKKLSDMERANLLECFEEYN